MTESEIRQAVRRAYNFACGYCGVREEDAGSELELDHLNRVQLAAMIRPEIRSIAARLVIVSKVIFGRLLQLKKEFFIQTATI